MTEIMVGFRLTPRTGWQSYVDPPEKPSNWKQDTFEAKLPELWEKKQADAHKHLAGGIASQIAVTTAGGEVKVCKNIQEFVTEIGANIVTEGRVALIGFDLSARLRQCGWALIMAGKTVPGWVWSGSGAIDSDEIKLYDLYSISGAKSDRISLDAWMRAWGLGPVPDTLTATEELALVSGTFNRMGIVT